MKRHTLDLIVAAALLLLFAGAAMADSATGTVKAGYTFVDNQGNQALNQETYNYYEGFGLSFNNWVYSFKSGATLAADLNNITLNNRVLMAALNRPGQYTLSITNSQYRRIYDSSGSAFTRRASTGIEARYQFGRYLKFGAGYSVMTKHGQDFEVLSPISDTLLNSTDYTQSSYHVGTEIGNRRGTFRADYRHFIFDDHTAANLDRNADNLNLVATTSVPHLNWLFLTSGYAYRIDHVDNDSTELTTNQPWGSVKAYLKHGFVLDYRFIYGMSKHTGPLQSTDNILHVATVGKNWPRYGGVRVGWEYRIADDFINKTTSNGFLGNGWLRPTDRLFFTCFFATRKKSVDEGTILTGDEDATRYTLSGNYSDTSWGNFSIKWEDRLRKNPDISSKVDFSGITPQLTFKKSKWGSLTITYSFYHGKYDDMSDTLGYAFQDQVLSGTLRTREVKGLVGEFGGVYYRSIRDQDLEKSNLNFGLMYTFAKTYHVEARYNVFNYDNFLLNRSYYTGNIVEVNLSKDITL